VYTDIKSMWIDVRKTPSKWIAEVWSDDQNEPLVAEGFKEPYPEDTYREINQWCYNTLGYQTRTAFHIFEFKNQSDLNWFVLRWQ
jgi:hypothetical protein